MEVERPAEFRRGFADRNIALRELSSLFRQVVGCRVFHRDLFLGGSALGRKFQTARSCIAYAAGLTAVRVDRTREIHRTGKSRRSVYKSRFREIELIN